MLSGFAGCHAKRKTRSAENSDAYADKLKPIVEAHELKVMHWPNFADYDGLVKTFYDDRNYEVAWTRDAKPTAQATAFIQAFKDASRKGLSPEDFDASLWDARVTKLAGKNDDDIAQFDAAMTVSVMRYISDLRLGRVNPTHFNFDINTAAKKYDLPEFVSDNAVDAGDVPKLIASVEPDSESYRKLEEALGRYLDLAKQQANTPDLQTPLPPVAKPISPGGTYGGIGPLRARLALEGDLAGGTDASANASGVYTPDLVDAVKHFQDRHGLTADGKLTQGTVDAINVPLAARVAQMDDSLERWRWLPNEYVNAPLMVNLPEFVLRGYDGTGAGHTLDFTMKVVVGKAAGGEHETPVFTHEMRYLIFRPYWNVPLSIIKKELAPHIARSGLEYLAAKNYEIVDGKGEPVEATAAQVERGGVIVREKPGPTNSLGLVKFMFPNEYDIYLHSTPSVSLFNRTRRDFSHGCVRVQKPEDLAVWVLRNNPGSWDLDKVHDAMENGEDNKQVSLKQPIPIVIFYLTANVAEDGTVHFFDDLYGYDRELEAVLRKGMPYPATQGKVNPHTIPGETD